MSTAVQLRSVGAVPVLSNTNSETVIEYAGAFVCVLIRETGAHVDGTQSTPVNSGIFLIWVATDRQVNGGNMEQDILTPLNEGDTWRT